MCMNDYGMWLAKCIGSNVDAKYVVFLCTNL